MRRRATHAELRAEGVLAERMDVVQHLTDRADRLEAGDGSRMSEDKMMFARRLRALAEDLRAKLHKADADG